MRKDIEPESKQAESLGRRSLRWAIKNSGKSLALVIACSALIIYGFISIVESKTINGQVNSGQPTPERAIVTNPVASPNPNRSPTPTAMIVPARVLPSPSPISRP